MHQFPSDPSVRTQWVQFVRRHRQDYKDPSSKYSSLCSAHFDESGYEKKMSVVRSVKEEYKIEMRVFLKPTAVPTRDSVTPQSPEKISHREKRKLRREAMAKVNVPPKKKKPSSSAAHATLEPASDSITSLDQGAESEAEPEEPASDNLAAYGTASSSMQTDTKSCKGCKHKAEYQKAMRAKKGLLCKVKGLKKEVSSLKATIAELQSCVAEKETEEEEECAQPRLNFAKESSSHGQNYFSWSSTGEEEEDGAVEGNEQEWGPIGVSSEEEETTEDEEEIPELNANDIKADADSSDCHYNQPKFIVFYEMLLKIFLLFCFNCKKNNPQVSMVQNGTMVTVRQKCAKCIKGYVWTSQRMMPHGKYPAGNVLLSLAILMAGASISKILLVFRHMGLQTDLVNKVRDLKDVVWAGDGRYDSMGHSAKYAAGVTTGVFIPDRHRGIPKWIRENCPGTTHFYDIWHVARSVTKKLLAASKEKGCEIIQDWMKGIRRHMYWSATSTKPGFGSLILAKRNSFLGHVANKHADHPDPLYKVCNHGSLPSRKWIKIGPAAYDKLKSLLTGKALLNDIKQLSPDAQRSCLEGFHATLNHWHPKMIGFSWLGSFCRHILAILHFNENLHRDTQVNRDGEKYFQITYPKFKLVYAEDIKKLLFNLSKQEMKEVFDRYSARTPEPLTAQFSGHIDKETAVKARKEKQGQGISTQLFPAREEQEVLQEASCIFQEPASGSRAVRKCSKCKRPGHTRRNCPE
ncbi:hypothetical protein P5673_025663 [Acropora cervicornis]|uniref:Uncharacterized protein n=1 Tax=Acropora cervicornis TaxID=6130 RepID=A0AAD9UWX1_ACRCE|nr:hypothetical protein P5673_025663 [Acropora cervicornis]